MFKHFSYLIDRYRCIVNSKLTESFISQSLAVFCSLLPDLANGAITYGSDTTAPFDYLTTATYSCDSGYGLGVAPMGFMRTCGTIGEWTGSDVTCDRKLICHVYMNYTSAKAKHIQ